MNKEKKDVISGVFWKFSERMAAQLVSFVVSIVLARLLLPSEYGTISLVTVFISIANVFVTSGFGTSLIQKKDADDIDFSTVFYFSIVFTIVLYVILFLCAPIVADFYNIPILNKVLRVLAWNVPIMGINSVQQAYVSRKMMFKKFFYATSIGTIISAVVGIAMAYLGYGVWALVAQSLVNSIINTITLQCIIDWVPIKAFSFHRLRKLFSYGWKLLAQGLVLQIYSSLRSLIIGKIYTTSDLAYYTKGNQFPDLVCTNIDTAINAALFPAMAREQSSFDKVKIMTRRTTQISSYVLNPVLIGLMAIAEPLILLLLTEKWLLAVPYLRICCIALLFRAPQTAILQAIKAVGRSDSILEVDIPIRMFAILALLVSVHFGVLIFAISEIVITVFGTILYSIMANKILKYTYLEICEDFLINTGLAVIMGTIVLIVGRIIDDYKVTTMLIQIILGVILYLLLSLITKNESYNYILGMIKEIVIRKKQ